MSLSLHSANSPRTCYSNKRDNSELIMEKSPTPDPQPSYVKLAMRNMVRKGGTSLKHFALTAVGLLSVLVGLAYLTR
jgi:hypothetical protein